MKRILLLLADGFEAAEASVFTDVLGWNKLEGDGSTEVITAGLHDRLKCTWNFTVIPEIQLDGINVTDFDALAIPGGFEEANFYRDAYDERFLEVIRAFHAENKWIASICVAALALGKSGVLKGKTATTYNFPGSPRQDQLRSFGAKVVNEPVVVDGKLITSYNPSTAFEVAFTLLEKLTTSQNCQHVRALMGFS
ncbi:DJ-1/PfpI family protein [Sporolactobacillus shoreae]|uniref:DJ-1/PfpI family protein n=1 Tax=Sporolactobacillus shoreae TaxID=1465501 RepID=A0A4Z0GK63_9BACL|nr:DJ-1/PfpI family protein [Sporolactobacillus shoreae]TGA96063.1 DJ-1/PfpI family protein [Sporolactobacillus shoreae]